MKSLESKVVWLMGATSGIGEAMAYVLSKRRCRLILSGRNVEALERVCRCASNGNAESWVLPVDLTQSESLEAFATAAWNHFGKIDCLLLNAGLAVRDLAVNTTEAMDRLVMETNYFGPVRLAKCILPKMIIAGGGHIVSFTVCSRASSDM